MQQQLLADVDLEYGVVVFVSPGPIICALLFFESLEVDIPSMILFYPDAIGAIFVIVPYVIVVVGTVMVAAVFRAQCTGGQRDRGTRISQP